MVEPMTPMQTVQFAVILLGKVGLKIESLSASPETVAEIMGHAIQVQIENKSDVVDADKEFMERVANHPITLMGIPLHQVP